MVVNIIIFNQSDGAFPKAKLYKYVHKQNKILGTSTIQLNIKNLTSIFGRYRFI